MADTQPGSTTERVEALLEKQLAYMENHQRGPLPFVPSGDTTALRDLVATLLDLHRLAGLRAKAPE